MYLLLPHEDQLPTMMRRCIPALNIGTCVKWFDDKGFGFVKDSESGTEYFCHFRQLMVNDGGFRALAVGQEVQFTPESNNGKTNAANVCSPDGSNLPDGPRPQGGDGGFRGGGGGGGRGGGGNFRGGGGRGGGGFRGRGGFNRQDTLSNPDEF